MCNWNNRRHEYVEGNNTCADSIPEEEDALEELERGNNAPLSEISKVISVCTNISQNISEDMEYLYYDDGDENVSYTRQILIEDHDKQNCNAAENLYKPESRKAQKHVATSSFRTNRNVPYPTSSKPASKSAVLSKSPSTLRYTE